MSPAQDILNMPPKGGWKPSLSLATVLQSVVLLLAVRASAERQWAWCTDVHWRKRQHLPPQALHGCRRPPPCSTPTLTMAW